MTRSPAADGRRYSADFYVSDLDGTLLDADARLSAFAKRSLTKLLDDGVHFTVATARSLPSVRTIFRGVTLRLPIVEQNGACVTDLATGERLVTRTIDPDVARGVLRLFELHRVDPIIACAQRNFDRVFYDRLSNDGTRWYIEEKRLSNDPRLREEPDLSACLGEGVLSITTLAAASTTTALAADLQQHFAGQVQLRLGANTYARGFWELSVLSHTATKSAAIEALRQLRGLEHARLVVFGDAENDVDMFRNADVRVAVSNAVPEVLALADHIAESHEQDGVIRWLLGAQRGAHASTSAAVE